MEMEVEVMEKEEEGVVRGFQDSTVQCLLLVVVIIPQVAH